MKTAIKWGIVALLPLFFFACKDDDAELFSAVQPSSDNIVVKSDTFHITMEAQKSDKIPMRIVSDTLLLGSYTDRLIGKTTGEILAQLACPINPKLPSNVEKTSLNIRLTYTNHIANGDSLISLKIYRMNTGTFSARGEYFSDINPADYCNTSELLGQITDFKVNKTTNGTIYVELKNDFKSELIDSINNNSPIFSSQEKFLDYFKGIYIEVVSANVMFTISYVSMNLEYSYKNPGGSPIDDFFVFPANKEVRQVNRIVHEYVGGQIPTSDTAVFVTSPAGINAKVSIPLQKIKDYYGITVDERGVTCLQDGRRLNINHARLKFEIADDTIAAHESASSLKYPPYLLLLKEADVETFFKTSKYADGQSTILAAYNSDSSVRAYEFDLRDYFMNELKKQPLSAETDKLVLIPVYQDSQGIVKYENRLFVAPLRSQGSSQPLKLNLIISGF